MELSCSTDRVDDVSLIRCHLHNDGADPRRVRLRNRLDGPTLPPRRGGVPEAGWDAAGVTVRIAPEERRSLGFAVAAPPVEPPVEVVDDEAIEPHADGLDGEGGYAAHDRGSTRSAADDPDAGTAVRELGSYRPPGDVVVVAGDVDGAAAPSGAGGVDGGDADDLAAKQENDGDTSGADGGETSGLGVVDESHHEGGDDGGSHGDVEHEPSGTGVSSSEFPSPGPTPSTDSPDVDGWLDGFERRIERGERVTDADLTAATEAVADAGGVDALAELEGRLRNDAVRLRRVSERAAALAERADAADVPVGALETLS